MSDLFRCQDCDFTTDEPFDLHEVRDHNMRVMPGDIEPAGECPLCGALVACPDSDIEDHTVQSIAKVMRQRGWTVIEPGKEPD